jgi:hypothetical protein
MTTVNSCNIYGFNQYAIFIYTAYDCSIKSNTCQNNNVANTAYADIELLTAKFNSVSGNVHYISSSRSSPGYWVYDSGSYNTITSEEGDTTHYAGKVSGGTGDYLANRP